MGRSSQLQAAENRSRIVEIACHLFRKHGVENVSVSDVMRVMGMTVGGFYKHFESKNALIAEAFSLGFDQASDAWRTIFEDVVSSESSTEKLVSEYLINRPGKCECPMVAFAAHVSTGLAADTVVKEYHAGVRELYEQFLVGCEAPVKDTDCAEPEQKSLILFAAMVGARVLGQSMRNVDLVKRMEIAINEMASEFHQTAATMASD